MQLLVLGGGTVNGMDPVNGQVLWSHPHDRGNAALGWRHDGRRGDALKEVIALSADGQTLTIAVTRGEATTTLSYGRVQSAGPCKSWPTPCR